MTNATGYRARAGSIPISAASAFMMTTTDMPVPAALGR